MELVRAYRKFKKWGIWFEQNVDRNAETSGVWFREMFINYKADFVSDQLEHTHQEIIKALKEGEPAEYIATLSTSLAKLHEIMLILQRAEMILCKRYITEAELYSEAVDVIQDSTEYLTIDDVLETLYERFGCDDFGYIKGKVLDNIQAKINEHNAEIEEELDQYDPHYEPITQAEFERIKGVR